MSKTVVFYSKNQIETIQSEVEAGVPVPKIAQKYAKPWNRNEESLRTKIYKMVRTNNNEVYTKRGRKPANIVSQENNKGITLSSGFVFDFKPQRAEMHQDHVRLYF
jgi:hypothetical protein